MDRLTRRSEGTKHAYFPNCFKGCDGVCTKCDHETDYCETLAKYEDTGLTPEQIVEMDKLYTEKCRELAEYQKRQAWIPVHERLPEVPEGTADEDCPEFIVTIAGAEKPTALKYSLDGAWFDDLGNVYSVYAWMPFPEIYKIEY